MRRSLRESDGGQLMMLAGIVITISFILTALTLSQVSALEKQAAADGPSPIITEWRFLHERLASNFQTAVGPETTNATFNDTVLPTVIATFRNIEAEKGYDTVIRLAGGAAFDRGERHLVDPLAPTKYKATTDDGSVTFTHAIDGKDDGILWQTPCPDPTGPAGGCLGGIYVYVRLTDGAATLEETMLFPLNQ